MVFRRRIRRSRILGARVAPSIGLLTTPTLSLALAAIATVPRHRRPNAVTDTAGAVVEIVNVKSGDVVVTGLVARSHPVVMACQTGGKHTLCALTKAPSAC